MKVPGFLAVATRPWLARFMRSDWSDPKIALPGGFPLEEISMDSAMYSTPIVANNVLFLATKETLYAIETIQPLILDEEREAVETRRDDQIECGSEGSQ